MQVQDEEDEEAIPVTPTKSSPKVSPTKESPTTADWMNSPTQPPHHPCTIYITKSLEFITKSVECSNQIVVKLPVVSYLQFRIITAKKRIRQVI